MSPLLIGLIAYVALQLAIGFVVSLRIRDEADYLLAGRRLGPVLTTASVFATWFGAETCVGAAGEVYQGGLRATLSDPFGYALCLLLFGTFLVVPLYERGLTTLADLFRQRFSKGVETLVALMLIPSSLFWASAQIRAFGAILASRTELSLEAGILIAASVACIYTVFGGLLADAYTDLIQGGVLVMTLATLLVVAVYDHGGIVPTWELVRQAGSTGHQKAPFAVFEAWAVPVLGSLFAQELLSRGVAAKSAGVARRSTLMAAGAYLLVGLVPIVLGALARATLPGAGSDSVLSELSMHHLGSAGYLLLTGALVSAILSTVDSALLVAAAFVSHNLAPAAFPKLSDRGRLWTARASVLVLSALAYLAARGETSVHDLVHEASAAGSAGICVAGLMALFSCRGKAPSAYAALLLGACTWAICTYVYVSPFAFSFSLVSALAGYAAFGLLPQPATQKAPRPAPERESR